MGTWHFPSPARGLAVLAALAVWGSVQQLGLLSFLYRRLLERLGKIPAEGDATEVDGWLLTVTTMDKRRIAEVEVAPVRAAPEAAPEEVSAPTTQPVLLP